MQNDYIIYGNKYIQDSVYLWGTKGGEGNKRVHRGFNSTVFYFYKKKNLKQIQENVKIQLSYKLDG